MSLPIWKRGYIETWLYDREENSFKKKEKLLIMSNFIFLNNIFKSHMILMSHEIPVSNG